MLLEAYAMNKQERIVRIVGCDASSENKSSAASQLSQKIVPNVHSGKSSYYQRKTSRRRARRAVALAAARGPSPSPSRAFSAVREVSSEPGFEILLENARWKWAVRKRVRRLLEAEHVCSVDWYNYPNFADAYLAAEQLWRLPAFGTASCVSVSNDAAQKPVRVMTMRDMKKLLVAWLRNGPFLMLDPCVMGDNDYVRSGSGDPVTLGKAVGLDTMPKVDLLVVGSVAVNPATGARLGKGMGMTDLEYALLRCMGSIDDSTLVATTVHDKQLVEDLHTERMEVYDLPVDVICTPTQIIYTETTIPKPTGVYWNRLTHRKLFRFEVLRELKRRIEEETGTELSVLSTAESLPRLPYAVEGPAIFVSGFTSRISETQLKEQLKQAGVFAEKVMVYKSNCARVTVGEDCDLEQQILFIQNELNVEAKRDQLV